MWQAMLHRHPQTQTQTQAQAHYTFLCRRLQHKTGLLRSFAREPADHRGR